MPVYVCLSSFLLPRAGFHQDAHTMTDTSSSCQVSREYTRWGRLLAGLQLCSQESSNLLLINRRHAHGPVGSWWSWKFGNVTWQWFTLLCDNKLSFVSPRWSSTLNDWIWTSMSLTEKGVSLLSSVSSKALWAWSVQVDLQIYPNVCSVRVSVTFWPFSQYFKRYLLCWSVVSDLWGVSTVFSRK